jgi:ElaB/YqjD/DUF883 family membrane-anchored ribosome-binding protein
MWMEISSDQGSNRLDSLTPEEQSVLDFLADRADVSSDEYRREFEAEFAALTPEEKAEFKLVIDTLNEVLPGINASLDRIGQAISRSRATMREMRKQMSAMSDRVTRIENALRDGLLN